MTYERADWFHSRLKYFNFGAWTPPVKFKQLINSVLNGGDMGADPGGDGGEHVPPISKKHELPPPNKKNTLSYSKLNKYIFLTPHSISGLLHYNVSEVFLELFTSITGIEKHDQLANTTWLRLHILIFIHIS